MTHIIITYIKAPGGYISAKQNSLLGVTKFKEGTGSLLLLELAMEFQGRKVMVVEKFSVILDTCPTAEENDDLLLFVGSVEERVQEKEAFVSIANYVSLLQSVSRAELCLFVDIDV